MASTKLVKTRVSRMELKRELTGKMQAFIAEYPIDFDGAKAVIRAGYSKKGAAGRAVRLLKNPLIRKALGNALHKRVEKCKMTAERLEQELAHQALRDPIDLCDKNGYIRIDSLKDIPEGMRRCIDGIKCVRHTNPKTGEITQTIDLKLTSKLGAIELGMKYLKMLVDTQEITLGVPFDWDGLTKRGNVIDVLDVLENQIPGEQSDD